MPVGPEWGHQMWRYKKSPVDLYKPTSDVYAAKDLDDSGWALLKAPIAAAMHVFPGRPGHAEGYQETWDNASSGSAKVHGFPESIVANEDFWVRRHFTREEMENSFNEGWFKYQQAETRRRGMPGTFHIVIYGMVRLWWNGRMVTKDLPAGGAFESATGGLPIEDDNVAAIHVSRIGTSNFPHPEGDRWFGMYIDAFPFRGKLPGGWNTGPLTFGGGIQPVPWKVRTKQPNSNPVLSDGNLNTAVRMDSSTQPTVEVTVPTYAFDDVDKDVEVVVKYRAIQFNNNVGFGLKIRIESGNGETWAENKGWQVSYPNEDGALDNPVEKASLVINSSFLGSSGLHGTTGDDSNWEGTNITFWVNELVKSGDVRVILSQGVGEPPYELDIVEVEVVTR